MKISEALKILKGLSSNSDRKGERKINQELLGVLINLQVRDIPNDQLQSIEEALDHLLVNHAQGGSIWELRRRKNQFIKNLTASLSLVEEGHYVSLGLVFGTACGAAIGSIVHGFADIPTGTSATGLFVGLGLSVGLLVAAYLEADARKQDRVLKTTIR